MDGVDMTPEALYRRLAHDPVLPKTSQPSPGEFADHYRQAREKHQADSVLCVTLGKLLSGTYASAEAARNLVDFPVTVVDSTTVTSCLGFSVLAAADARDRGASLDEAATIAAAAGKRSKLMFTLDTLEFLHRGGRIGGARRFIGTALSIKPILQIKDGEVATLETIRSRVKALQRIVEIATAPNWPRPLQVSVLHTHAREVEQIAQEVKQRMQPDLFITTLACAAVGVHAGPGTIGIAIMPAAGQPS